MSKIVVILVLLLVLAAVFFVGANGLASSEIRRLDAQARLAYEQGRARAMVIEAQGQARLDSALASQILMMAALPWAVLVVGGLLGFGVLVLVFFLLVIRFEAVRNQPQVIYLAHPGWLALPGGSDRRLLKFESGRVEMRR